jgi:O-glycosyl hydrolase
MNRKLPVWIICMIISTALIIGCSQLGDSSTAAKPILKPYISIQPKGASYSVGGAYTNPELSIEIYDWDNADGTLDFQWYTFTDIEEYCEDGGDEITSGVTQRTIPGSDAVRLVSAYTPSLTPAADEIHYYYVVVTNINEEALDETSAQIQSEVVAISFSAAGDPLYPVIKSNPANAAYGWGALLNPLKVTADTPAGGQLTYQWFINDIYSTEGAEVIPESDNNSITPAPADMVLGNNHFFAKVANTVGGKRAVSTSIPAIITIRPGKRAAPPRITTQPKDAIYIQGDPTIAPLSVEGESVDLGTITYQWYSNTDTKNSGGTLITDATNKTYAIPAGTTGSTYYYCLVTNTNENVTDQKTSSIPSNPVKVRIGNGTGSKTANAFITITNTGNDRYQYIRGYGGMDVAWGNFPMTKPEETELMYDPNKLGYNMLRIMIRADNVDIEKTMTDLVAGDRPYYYDNVKIVNKYGGYVAASPWTPPKNWKSNNSINGGGYLIPAYYKLFANYLRRFSQHMYDNGAPIFAISISNEPNYTAGYDGCEWTPEEMRNFFLECGHFTDGIRGYGGGRETPYVWTMNGESANTPTINRAALQNPQSKAAIDVLARHIYGSRTDSLWNNNSDKALITKKDVNGNDVMMEVWMTEHNINSANATGYFNDSTWNYVWRFLNDVDLVVRINNENAFVWWASKRFYSMVGDGQAGTTEGAALPRGWALSHYAKFTTDYTRVRVRLTTGQESVYLEGPTAEEDPGTRKIGSLDRGASMVNRTLDDMDNPSARITAFQSADGNSISMVLWTPTNPAGKNGINLGTVEVTLPAGFVANSVVAVKSWGQAANQLFQPDDSVALSDDKTKAYITIGASQIMSVRFSK